MAAPADDEDRRQLSRFLNDLYELAGFTSDAAWARASGYPASNLSKVKRGLMGIEGPNLLRLIEAAAAKAERPASELAAAAQRRDGQDHLARLAAATTRLEQGQVEMTKTLGEVLTAVSRKPATRRRTQAPAKRRRKAQ